MKNSTRGQVSVDPVWPVGVVAVIVTIYIVGRNVLESMSAQLPSGEIMLCGGGCGTMWNLTGFLMVLFLILVVLFLLRSGIMGRFSE